MFDSVVKMLLEVPAFHLVMHGLKSSNSFPVNVPAEGSDGNSSVLMSSVHREETDSFPDPTVTVEGVK